MKAQHFFPRLGLIVLSLLLVAAILVATLPQRVQAATEDTGSFSAYAQNGKIYISLTGFNQKHVFLLKARDAKQGVGGWKNLGKVRVDKKTSLATNFAIPKALSNNIYLNVCIKDQTSDKLTCRAVVNPNGRIR